MSSPSIRRHGPQRPRLTGARGSFVDDARRRAWIIANGGALRISLPYRGQFADVHVTEAGVKNITLSAGDDLIEAARHRAASERTTLNEQFRLWLADYVGGDRQAAKAAEVMRELQGPTARWKQVDQRRNERALTGFTDTDVSLASSEDGKPARCLPRNQSSRFRSSTPRRACLRTCASVDRLTGRWAGTVTFRVSVASFFCSRT